MTPEREADIRARAWGLATSDDHGAVDRIDLLAALDEARRERDAARAEVAALQVVMGRLREAAEVRGTMIPSDGDLARVDADADDAERRTLARGEVPGLVPLYVGMARSLTREVRRLRTALAAIPADLGRKTIEEAEERGARWGIEAAIEAAPESEYFVQWPNPAEVCRAARKEGT